MLKKLKTKFTLWWFTGLLKEEIQDLETILKIKGNTIPGRPPAEFTQEFLEDIERYGLVHHKLGRAFFEAKARQNELSLEVSTRARRNREINLQKKLQQLPSRVEALEKELEEIKCLLRKEVQ